MYTQIRQNPSTYNAFLAAKVAKEHAKAPTHDPKYPLPNDMKSNRRYDSECKFI